MQEPGSSDEKYKIKILYAANRYSFQASVCFSVWNCAVDKETQPCYQEQHAFI